MLVGHDALDEIEQPFAQVDPDRVAAVHGTRDWRGRRLPPPPGYIEGVAELCERTGALLVANSVICGFGRLGSWFGIDRGKVMPAMIAFAKGMTSAYVLLGGVIVNRRLLPRSYMFSQR